MAYRTVRCTLIVWENVLCLRSSPHETPLIMAPADIYAGTGAWANATGIMVDNFMSSSNSTVVPIGAWANFFVQP